MKTKTRKKQGKPRPVILADIVERVVRAAEPEKIVLFGSAARVTMGPDSDYDLLVLKGGGYARSRCGRAHRLEHSVYGRRKGVK
jgi:predicted nucleotidyltransferase